MKCLMLPTLSRRTHNYTTTNGQRTFSGPYYRCMVPLAHSEQDAPGVTPWLPVPTNPSPHDADAAATIGQSWEGCSWHHGVLQRSSSQQLTNTT